jgi:uncharacterized membrane protein
VTFSDWLLALHVLSAIIVIGSLTALWTLILATRPAAPVIAAESATSFGRVFGPLVGAAMMGAIIFGVWLAIDDDAYQVWDGWIIASLLLWAVSLAAGVRAGQAFERDPVAGRQVGIRLQTLSSLAVIAILLLMIWKPGA